MTIQGWMVAECANDGRGDIVGIVHWAGRFGFGGLEVRHIYRDGGIKVGNRLPRLADTFNFGLSTTGRLRGRWLGYRLKHIFFLNSSIWTSPLDSGQVKTMLFGQSFGPR
jgi:hypothetical protein